MLEVVTAISLWELAKHGGTWLSNLKRAKHKRKHESINAVRSVVIAAQQTSVYTRQLNETGKRSHKTERELSKLWSELGYELQDIGISKLAKRCLIKGKHWADPTRMDKEFLVKADVGLERMEQLANEILEEYDA
jgi:hypothetical protein